MFLVRSFSHHPHQSPGNKKSRNYGFTLIELMIVMAIIAILATAGLSAYTGYIKKARDATRISDLKAINTIVMGAFGINGNPPADQAALNTLVSGQNNGQTIEDPLGTAVGCLSSASGDTIEACGYQYYTCDSGTGYLMTAKLESKSNQSMYTTNGSAVGYSVGNCSAGATLVGGGAGSGSDGGGCFAVGDTCGDLTKYVSATLRTTTSDAGAMQWSTESINTGTTSTIDGAGNTATLAALAGVYPAADYCAGLSVHGHDDWYLPAKDELAVLRVNRVALGGEQTGWYWSSTENGASYAWRQYFGNGGQNTIIKTTSHYIRCVRMP